jgi:Histidine kinase-, DNA gyrase B-, and HSP90-like ATPase
MVSDRLLTEIERQKKYLGQLPETYEFPLFNGRRALESQRRSGYRHTAAAAREIADNAIEAGATRIDVILQRPDRLKEHQRQESVSAVAFVDNGSGMLPKMARFALSWGGGTHFEDPETIGKFGFGLPNASINQTRRVEVYTKTVDAKKISMAWLDINEVSETGLQTVEEPIEAELPDFVARQFKSIGAKFEHGTVVVWLAPDRLSYRTAAPLKEHLLDDFGVTYRYLLGDVEIFVEGARVEPVDPLFLTAGMRYYVPEAEGGAQLAEERTLPVKYYLDRSRGITRLKKVEATAELSVEDEDLVAVGSINIKVARFPIGFAEYKKGKKLENDAQRRFEIRKSRRGISFVRANREIETLDAFPRSARDEASGLGQWPLLQSYAYYWGVEVKFSPALDEVFGITNDKQTVRPIEDFWRLLADEDVDTLLRKENAWQVKLHEKKKPQATPSNETSPAEAAAAAADSIGGQRPKVPDHAKPAAQESMTHEATKQVGVSAKSIEEAIAAVEAEAKRRPYKIDYFDDPNGPFYEPRWEFGTSIVVRINRLHPFYETLYADLLKLEGGTRAKEAVDVLFITLGKAELTVDDETAKMWYERQRTARWSPFLADALKILSQTLRPTEEPEEGNS